MATLIAMARLRAILARPLAMLIAMPLRMAILKRPLAMVIAMPLPMASLMRPLATSAAHPPQTQQRRRTLSMVRRALTCRRCDRCRAFCHAK